MLQMVISFACLELVLRPEDEAGMGWDGLKG